MDAGDSQENPMILSRRTVELAGFAIDQYIRVQQICVQVVRGKVSPEVAMEEILQIASERLDDGED